MVNRSGYGEGRMHEMNQQPAGGHGSGGDRDVARHTTEYYYGRVDNSTPPPQENRPFTHLARVDPYRDNRNEYVVEVNPLPHGSGDPRFYHAQVEYAQPVHVEYAQPVHVEYAQPGASSGFVTDQTQNVYVHNNNNFADNAGAYQDNYALPVARMDAPPPAAAPERRVSRRLERPNQREQRPPRESREAREARRAEEREAREAREARRAEERRATGNERFEELTRPQRTAVLDYYMSRVVRQAHYDTRLLENLTNRDLLRDNRAGDRVRSEIFTAVRENRNNLRTDNVVNHIVPIAGYSSFNLDNYGRREIQASLDRAERDARIVNTVIRPATEAIIGYAGDRIRSWNEQRQERDEGYRR